MKRYKTLCFSSSIRNEPYIADELERDDRKAFDEAVLESYNIQTPLREIYDSLLRLVEIRQTVLDDYSDD